MLVKRGFDPFWIDSPHGSGLQVRQPNRPQSDANRIATFADELLHHLVGRRIDSRDREAEGGYPYRTFPGRDVAAPARNADLDGRDNLVRLWIDSRHAAVALVQRPDRTFADRQES